MYRLTSVHSQRCAARIVLNTRSTECLTYTVNKWTRNRALSVSLFTILQYFSFLWYGATLMCPCMCTLCVCVNACSKYQLILQLCFVSSMHTIHSLTHTLCRRASTFFNGCVPCIVEFSSSMRFWCLIHLIFAHRLSISSSNFVCERMCEWTGSFFVDRSFENAFDRNMFGI